MDKESKHYLFLSSANSSDYFPFNTHSDFTVRLTERLHFPGNWECTLIDIFFPRKLQTDVVIYCDLCEQSFINNTKLPVLRTVQNGYFRQFDSFQQLVNIPIARSETQQIRIYITTITGEDPSFIDQSVHCTLLLKRVS